MFPNCSAGSFTSFNKAHSNLAANMNQHLCTLVLFLVSSPAWSQNQNTTPPNASQVSIAIEGDQRVIRANGLPDHLTGQFPNRGNPNRIAPQSYAFRVP